MSGDQLPIELWIRTFSFLPTKEIARSSSVCKLLQSAAQYALAETLIVASADDEDYIHRGFYEVDIDNYERHSDDEKVILPIREVQTMDGSEWSLFACILSKKLTLRTLVIKGIHEVHFAASVLSAACHFPKLEVLEVRSNMAMQVNVKAPLPASLKVFRTNISIELGVGTQEFVNQVNIVEISVDSHKGDMLGLQDMWYRERPWAPMASLQAVSLRYMHKHLYDETIGESFLLCINLKYLSLDFSHTVFPLYECLQLRNSGALEAVRIIAKEVHTAQLSELLSKVPQVCAVEIAYLKKATYSNIQYFPEEELSSSGLKHLCIVDSDHAIIDLKNLLMAPKLESAIISTKKLTFQGHEKSLSFEIQQKNLAVFFHIWGKGGQLPLSALEWAYLQSLNFKSRYQKGRHQLLRITGSPAMSIYDAGRLSHKKLIQQTFDEVLQDLEDSHKISTAYRAQAQH